MKRRGPILLLVAVAFSAAVAAAAGAAGGADPDGGHGWLSVLPPVLAIGLALATRQVVVALLLGVYVGAVVIEGNPFTAFLRLGDRYLTDALADRSHASILIFTSILGGMVGVLSRSGATGGVVHWLAGRVRGRRGGMTATAVMGTVIFFDDYANTLLVGATMRPLTDRLKISREKLSWLVDSTAAPVATVAVISTWVGFEVGLIQEAMARLGGELSAYTFFLRSIPYSFYPLLTLAFVYVVAVSGRDFGPMLRAEERALQRGLVLRPGARPASDVDELEKQQTPDLPPAHPLVAGLPILAVILTTALGIFFGGQAAARAAGIAEPTVRDMLNNADSFAVLTWAALVGALTAIALTVGGRRLSLVDALEGYLQGMRAMVIAVTILILAWAMSAVCDGLGTAPYLVDVCKQVLSARLLPAVVFALAAAVSFATGTSWGTMAILMPLVFPLGLELPAAAGLAAPLAEGIHLASVSAVLAGAVFGDHCSPISDTTILSSLATGADHVDHVRTQLPYALTVAGAALLLGYLPAGWGLSPWISLAAGLSALLAVVLRLGRPAEGRPFEVLP